MAAESSTPRHRYPDQFKGENFIIWKAKMKSFLTVEKLWKVVDGTETDPGDADAAARTAQAAWMEKDGLAKSHILTAVHDDFVHPILEATTSKESWDILTSNFAAKSQQNALFYLEEWINTRWDKSTDIEEHISHHDMLFRKFKEAGGNFQEDTMKAHILLMSLPSDFRSLVDAFYAKGGDLQYEEVKAAVRSRAGSDKRMSHGGKADPDGSYFSGKFGASGRGQNVRRFPKRGGYKGNPRASQSRKWENQSVTCSKCGEEGHYASGCAKKLEQNRGGSRGRGLCSSRARQGGKVSSGQTFTCASKGVLKGKWIIDSGASQHYCNDLGSFTDYTEFRKPQQTFVGDGRIVMGYGSGKILWKGPCNSRNQILNVIYTPEMQQNLLSVKKMTEKGLEVTFG